ncbi:hypothetical protein JCM10213_007944 [Rhodosporidiobolus nylandii]
MSGLATGTCCVCGKVASQRCQPCGQAGWESLYCTREHQKLVWKAHKIVCGKHANAFQWPALTRAEELFILEHRKVDLDSPLFAMRTRRGPVSLQTMYDGAPNAQPRGGLQGDLHHMRTNIETLHHSWEQSQLAIFRCAIFILRRQDDTLLTPGPTPLPLLIASFFSNWSLALCKEAIGPIHDGPYGTFHDHDWYCLIQHQLLLCAAATELWVYRDKKKPAVWEHERFYKQAFGELERIVHEDVPRMAPKFAKKLTELPELCKKGVEEEAAALDGCVLQ